MVAMSCLACHQSNDADRGGAKVVSQGQAVAGTPPFNVLILVLDACRADKFGCNGFERPTTPNADAFAKDPDAVVFRDHHVQGTWTKPSTASLFTGLFVHQHGVFKGTEKVPAAGHELYRTTVLPPEADTLAERFRAAGFTTFAAVRNEHLIPDYGFGQGFDEYQALNYSGGDFQLIQKVVGFAERTSGKWFAYLHLSGCHNPFDVDHRDPAYMQRYGFPYDEAGRQRVGVDFTHGEINHTIRDGRVQLDDDDVRFLHLIYEAKLRTVDQRAIGPLLNWLRGNGHYDDSLIILTADHGEELYDHHGYGHGPALWEEVIHVPLIVKFPKGRKPHGLGQEVTALTSAVDLLPSLLALIGRPPVDRLSGVTSLEGTFADYSLAELGGWGWALLQGNYKLFGERRDGPLLFDLHEDPHEQHNLAAAEPDRVASMQGFVGKLRQASSKSATTAPVVEKELPPEVIERLRSLGYLR